MRSPAEVVVDKAQRLLAKGRHMSFKLKVGASPRIRRFAATAFAALFRNVSDLPVAVLRLGMVYGPDEPNRHRLVPYVVDSLLRGEAPRLSSGRRRIDWVYADDVVDAVLAAAVTPAAYGRMLDVGSASRYRSARWCR